MNNRSYTKFPFTGISKIVCVFCKGHLVKFNNKLIKLLNYSFDNDSTRQEELSRSLDSIVKCYQCLSNENLCWFHSETVKTVLIGDTKATLSRLKK